MVVPGANHLCVDRGGGLNLTQLNPRSAGCMHYNGRTTIARGGRVVGGGLARPVAGPIRS